MGCHAIRLADREMYTIISLENWKRTLERPWRKGGIISNCVRATDPLY
jgi:hypothetical protein